jgi:hypothetical protein
MSDDEPISLDELVLDIAEFMEDLVAHGVCGVDRSAKPTTYWLRPEEEMTAEARAYWAAYLH